MNIPIDQLAVQYMRVSTEEQKKGDSILSQKRYLKRYATEQEIVVYQEFADNGFSGKDDQRPAFQEMIEFLHKNPHIKRLLVRDQERLGRNALNLMELKVLIVQNELDLIIAEGKGSIDLNNPYDELLFGINAVTGEFFRKVTILRVKEGLARAKARGVILGRPKKELTRSKRLESLINAKAPITVIAELYSMSWKTAKREVDKIKREMKKDGVLTKDLQEEK